jgi:hypothetical protein
VKILQKRQRIVQMVKEKTLCHMYTALLPFDSVNSREKNFKKIVGE